MLILLFIYNRIVSNRAKKKYIIQFIDFTDEGKPLLMIKYLSFGNLIV